MSSSLDQLLTVMAQLRDPQTGCPWDRQQSWQSLSAYTLEETYEVLDAIARDDSRDLQEELGDLLFHIVFYARIAQERNAFTFDDICRTVSAKLIRRHPHVFGPQPGGDAPDEATWEQRKATERAQKARHSALDEIPLAMPALMRAQKIQQRCAAVGFDWRSLPPVLDKVREELTEVTEALTQPQVDPAHLEEEVGDLLFAVVNLARHLRLSAEETLQKASQKFERRFRQVETQLAAGGATVDQASDAELEAVWQQVKAQEKQA